MDDVDPSLLVDFFSHPEFIYRDMYMEHAINLRGGYRRDTIIELLERRRNRQRAVITMSALADKYRTNVYVHLTQLVESFL